MIEKLLQYILPIESPEPFIKGQLRSSYDEWDQPSRQAQITVMASLGAFLYVAFTLLDLSAWVSAKDEEMMLKLHLFLNTPMLLIISFLAYKKNFYKAVMPAIAAAPIIAATCHSYIASQIDHVEPFLPEAYLIVVWIFIVSGMTFRYALVSAIASSVILTVPAYYYMDESAIYVMHLFWIFCSFAFGLFGGLILDRARKTTFSNLQALQLLAVTDPLTGLFNRNELDHILSKEVVRCKRYGNSLGVLLIDIDHFKTVNDTYGHDVGDDVLRQTADALSACIRGNDTLIRWGGEEFVVIAIDVDQKSLMTLCEKLRTTIQNTHYKCTEKITVSVGAVLFKEGDPQQSLIARADKALYQAKEKGRNISILAA